MQESKSCALPLGDSPLPVRLAKTSSKYLKPPSHGLTVSAGWIQGLEPWASRATIWRANQLRHTHHILKMTSLKGFEPPTHGLEGRCSIQLSYEHIPQRLFVKRESPARAGDGNRTHVSSLEGWCSTIELHPRDLFSTIGVTGFEPATSWSQTRRSSQTEPHPDVHKKCFFATQGLLYTNHYILSTTFLHFTKYYASTTP